MKKILILNGGYSEIPLIQAAKLRGLYVIVTGNNQAAPGNLLADEYISCDYSDRKAVCQLAERKKVDAVCSGCNDLAYISAAYACEKLGLPGHDSYVTAVRLHHKDKFRAFMQENHLPAPRAIQCGDEVDVIQVSSLHFPVIVKPVDLFGGMGMKKCDTIDEVQKAVSEARGASREKTVLVEEFLEGVNHGFTTIVQNKKIVFYMADKEYHEYSPFAVSAASVPAGISQETIDCLKMQIEKIVEKLGLCDGLVHAQFILTKQQKPVILEICRRSPGDLYIEFVRYATGIHYPEIILSCEAGLDRMAVQQRDVTGYWVRYVLGCTRAGMLNKVVLHDKLTPYIKKTFIHCGNGTQVLRGQIYKAGIILFQFHNQEELELFMGKIPDMIEYQ